MIDPENDIRPKDDFRMKREKLHFHQEEEDAYDDKERWWWVFQNPFGMVVLAGLVIVCIIIGWLIFGKSSSTQAETHEVKVIRANPEPYKESPDSTSNASVDNIDKEVYKRLNQTSEALVTQESKVVEQEKPIDVNTLPDSKETESALHKPNDLRKITDNVGVKMPSPVLNEEYISEKNKKNNRQDSVIAKDNPDERIDVPKKLSPSKITKSESSKALTPGNYVIRLASFRKEETAKKEVDRVVKSLGKSLKGVGCNIKKVEGGSGVFYIVVVGKFKSLQKAKSISKVLKEKNFQAFIQKAQE